MSTLHNRGNKKSAATSAPSSQPSNHGGRPSGPVKKSNVNSSTSQKSQANPSAPNAWNATANKAPTKSKPNANAQDKFKEIRNEHLKAAKKYTENYESSSDEEDFECQPILESVFKSYNGDRTELQKTQEFLEHCFTSGASTCLICIGNVKRSDYIWSCDHCYSFFHLNCLQKWAKDSLSQQKIHQDDETVGYYNNQGEYIQKQVKAIKWCCPKCRSDYLPSEIPQHYACFCKKELNPANHLWLVPHSCGELCEKPLKSQHGLCSHRCMILCHPGPCPPCSQTIATSCDCKQSNLRTIRCVQQSWKCGKKCSKLLSCGIHACNEACHAECPPCTKKSQQQCICGNKTQERDCSSMIWSCEKLCNKFYECGRHRCKVKCHSGDCGLCPAGLLRSCPCGKETTQAPCSEEIEPCGGTCQKTLKCGNHICAERCHRGDCGQCLEIVEKHCRCGLYTKELPCSKQYLCEAKCKQMRDCNKHACNRKCCDGNCPPCDKICGKTLSCGKHKCTSCCHNGQCYPCNLKASVKCRCGNTAVQVACGREKKTKAPKCPLLCKIRSRCHHTNEHKCHMGECPPCTESCLLANDTTNCDHPCTARCHDAVKVLVSDKSYKPAGPWDVQPEKYELMKLPHPKCEVKVNVECIGGHETVLWPCWDSKPNSCGRMCGRSLKCGNHKCEKMCHTVDDKASMTQDKSCDECVEMCSLPRPAPGCVHPCERRCHPKPCRQCTIATKIACHCALTQVYFKCNDLYKEDEDNAQLEANREKLLSCGNRCIKNFPCGHRCTNVCHSGRCVNEESCRKKLKVYCECKNRKIETTCDKIRAGFTLICDETCTSRQNELKLIAEQQERVRKEREEEKNRRELVEFEKKFGKKKYKERKSHVVEDTGKAHIWKWCILAGAVAILAIFTFYLLSS